MKPGLLGHVFAGAPPGVEGHTQAYPIEGLAATSKAAGLPLLFLFSRARLPRAVGALALHYSLFLCFIDHFPSHYFAPLLALTAISAGGTLASWRPAAQRVGAALASVGLVAALMMGMG